MHSASRLLHQPSPLPVTLVPPPLAGSCCSQALLTKHFHLKPPGAICASRGQRHSIYSPGALPRKVHFHHNSFEAAVAVKARCPHKARKCHSQGAWGLEREGQGSPECDTCEEAKLTRQDITFIWIRM